jgi:hypothetical protein
MDSGRLASMIRRLGDTQMSRGACAGTLLALAVPTLPLRGEKVQAKKKGKKNGKKKCPPTPTPTPTLSCQEACPESCGSCVHRKVDSLLCSNGFSAGLTPCSSDSDCVGVKFGDTFFPYCATQTEARANGQLDDIGDGKGVCSSVLACTPN